MNVLFVYGSETGTTKRKVKAIEKAWASRGGKKFGSVTVKSGDEAAAEFAGISEKYDAIVVGVSSFGDGDPPEGYQLFLAELYKPSKTSGEEVVRKPLEGMQHAVLGFGSTVYETYQNCPRCVVGGGRTPASRHRSRRGHRHQQQQQQHHHHHHHNHNHHHPA